MGYNRYNQKLGNAAEDSAQCGSFHTQGGEAKLSENQDVVEEQIDKDRNDSCPHGEDGFACLPQRAAVTLGQGKGQKSPEHNL